jgi:hypothetical protein
VEEPSPGTGWLVGAERVPDQADVRSNRSQQRRRVGGVEQPLEGVGELFDGL